MMTEQLIFVQNQIAGLVFAGFGLSASVFSGKPQVMLDQHAVDYSLLDDRLAGLQSVNSSNEINISLICFVFCFFWLIDFG